MKLKGQISVMAVLLSTGLLLQAAPAYSSQKISDMSRYSEMMQEIGSLSPSELSLMELQREREDLLRNRPNENPRIFKNKLTILNNKITYLQGEIKRTNPHVVRTRLVPLTDKPPVRPVASEPSAAAPAPSAPRPEPVSVSLKEAARQETPRAKASLVWTPDVTQLKPSADAAARRSSPETLPVHVKAQSVLEPSPRAAMQEAEPPPVPAPGPASSQQKVKGIKTGADWKTMSRPDKEIYILSVMGSLSRRDVYLMKPYNFYIDTIDRAVEKNAALEEESVHRILMMTAYDSEPDTRKDLEKVWK